MSPRLGNVVKIGIPLDGRGDNVKHNSIPNFFGGEKKTLNQNSLFLEEKIAILKLSFQS